MSDRLQENMNLMGFSFGRMLENGKATATTVEDAMEALRKDVRDIISNYPGREGMDLALAEDMTVHAIKESLTTLTERICRVGMPEHEMLLSFTVACSVFPPMVEAMARGATMALAMRDLMQMDSEKITDIVESAINSIIETVDSIKETKH